MEITNRTVRILYVKDRGLLASDSVGRIHLFDDELNLIQSSPVVSNGQPIYAITVADKWVLGKDRIGNIMRWSLDTLDLVDYYDARTTCDSRSLLKDEEPTIKINRGITVWQNRVYVNNGYMQLVILDLDSFSVEKIVRSPTGDIPIEWISTDHPEVHAISDKKGHLYLGNMETLEFSTVLKLDTLSLHRVLFDQKHNRFWVTQDNGNRQSINVNNGIVIVLPNGEIKQQIQFARDDVEFLVFSDDYNKAIAGGFDGQLVIFDNSLPEVKIEKTITGFTHQLSDCTIGSKGQIYVLTMDGEILRFDENGSSSHRTSFRRQAIWDIQASLDNPQVLFCATDDGVIVVEVVLTPRGEPHIKLIDHQLSGFGFTRRIVPMPDGYIGITRDQKVFRADNNGVLYWHRHLSSLLHTLSVTPTYTHVLVATDEGGLVLDATTGELIHHISVDDLPIWASSVLPSGEYIFGNRHGTISEFIPENNLPKWRVELGGYPKRIWHQQNSLFITGGNGVVEIGVDGSGLKRKWVDIMENTCENALLVDGVICAVTYGCQLLAYEYESGDLIGLVENLPDFPKGITALRRANGQPVILVGGRGGYLSMFELDKQNNYGVTGALAHLHTIFLPRPGLQSTPVLSVSKGGFFSLL